MVDDESIPSDLDELERLVRGLPVRHKSRALDARVAATVAESRRARRLRWFAAAAVVTLAAAGALVAGNRDRKTPSVVDRRTASIDPRPTTVVQPLIRVEQIVYRGVDDGIVGLSDAGPIRQIRNLTIRDQLYIDPATNARLTIRRPTRSILFVPAVVN